MADWKADEQPGLRDLARAAAPAADNGMNPGTDAAPTAHDADAVGARVAELAALAVAVLAARVGLGEDIGQAVADVISTVFGAKIGSEVVDRLCGPGNADDKRANALLADPRAIDRIVAVVLELLSP